MRMFVFRIVRYSIGYLRYYIFRYIFKNIKKFSGDQGHLGLDTLEYNFKNIKRSITTHSRVYHMLYPLLALSYIDMNEDLVSRVDESLAEGRGEGKMRRET